MARNKVKLQYISNDALRRSTLRKRRRGLLKKVHEISVLCGVDACGIIYSPEEAAPQVWPQPQDARRMIRTFNNLPEVERTRKMTNHLAFMQDRVATSRDKVVKRENGNTKIEVRAILYEGFSGSDFAGLSPYHMWAVGDALDELIAKVFGRISQMSLPPQAQVGRAVGAGIGRGTAVGPVAAPVVAVPASASATASEEAGNSTLTMQSGEFPVEEPGDSDDATEVGDSEDDDE